MRCWSQLCVLGQGLVRSAARDDPEIAAQAHHMVFLADCTDWSSALHSSSAVGIELRFFPSLGRQRGLPGLSCPGAVSRRHARSRIGHNIFPHPHAGTNRGRTVGAHTTIGSGVMDENCGLTPSYRLANVADHDDRVLVTEGRGLAHGGAASFRALTSDNEVLSRIAVNRNGGCCVSLCDELLSASGPIQWRLTVGSGGTRGNSSMGSVVLFASNAARVAGLCRTMEHETGWVRVSGHGGGRRCDGSQAQRCWRRWRCGVDRVR